MGIGVKVAEECGLLRGSAPLDSNRWSEVAGATRCADTKLLDVLDAKREKKCAGNARIDPTYHYVCKRAMTAPLIDPNGHLIEEKERNFHK